MKLNFLLLTAAKRSKNFKESRSMVHYASVESESHFEPMIGYSSSAHKFSPTFGGQIDIGLDIIRKSLSVATITTDYQLDFFTPNNFLTTRPQSANKLMENE